MASQIERIQQKLVTEAQAGPFWPASTDPSTKLLTVDVQTEIAPSQVIVKDQRASFGMPRRNRRTYQLEVARWIWTMSLGFDREVSTEGFERRVRSQLLHLPRDQEEGLEQVTLKMLSAEMFHPPQQSPSVGTQATYTFEAELSPV